MDQKQGIIAILDALGAARYNDAEIKRFLKSRQRVLGILAEKAHAKEVRGQIESSSVSTFTFNDTVLIVYRTPHIPTLKDVEHFSLLLRKFAVDSLAEGILFRGSMSVGKFYVDEETNTVMGPAVTDAAGWYDAGEWVGINTTPHSTMVVQSMLEESDDDLGHLLVDYDVPFKSRSPLRLKAVNWPKGFVVQGVKPVADGQSPRAKCLSLLALHGVPKGAESKHGNTVDFFDHCIGLWEKKRALKGKKSRPKEKKQPSKLQ
jgi:hypothetical protein